jgi:hypothetical protein
MIDGRSPAAVALRKWRQEIIDRLGGLDNISAQKEKSSTLLAEAG